MRKVAKTGLAAKDVDLEWTRMGRSDIARDCDIKHQTLKPLNLKTSKGNGVAVAGESNKAFGLVQSFGDMSDLAAIKLVNINIENFGTVECYFDRLTNDLNLLKVPLTNGAQVTMLGTHTVVERTMILIWQ